MKLGIISELPTDTRGMVKIRTLYHNRLKRLWRDSVRAFVMAALDRIPIDTGMSRASFIPLSRDIRMVTIARAALRGHRAPRSGYAYNPRGERSIPHGSRVGEDAYTISFGSSQVPDMSFEFSIVVFQHRLHEFGFQTPAWKSMDFGEQAFRDYWNTNFDRVIQTQDLLDRILGR